MITWSSGIGESIYKGVSAPKVYSEILAIGDSATPEQIVEAARDEASELHKCFTWDNDAAADKWRKQEARQIRHFLVIQSDDKPEAPQVRAFHYIADGSGYKPAARVFKNPDEYSMLLKRAFAELHNFAERNRILKDELGEILEMIDALPI